MIWLFFIALFLTGFSLGYNGYTVWTNKWLQKLPASWLILIANLFVFIVLLVACLNV